jgi:hypothetical protein
MITQADARTPYQQWHLKIDRTGAMTWNGQNVSNQVLQRYMNELGHMPAGAGKLTVHLEPGISCAVVENIRPIIENSELCRGGRCIQDIWDYKTPFVE